MRRARLLAVIAIAAVLLVACRSGDLDQSFGSGGIVKLNWPGSFEANIGDVIQEVPTAKVVVAAAVLVGDPTSFTTHFGLARLTNKGTLDTSFGTGGYVDTDFGPESSAGSLTLLPDGKILAVGAVSERTSTGVDNAIALARYLPNGTLDTSFGTGGKTYTFFPGRQDGAAGRVALQDDGSILVADQVGPNHGGDFALARFKANGSVDTAFGAGGRLFIDLGGRDVPTGVARQSDDKLLVSGFSSRSGLPLAVAMVRYNPDFSLDATFGTGGEVLKSPGGRSYSLGGPTLVANGDIVLGGTSWVGPNETEATVVRFLPSGRVDHSFGASGVVLYNPTPNDLDEFGPLELAPNNKLVTVLTSGQFSAGLARFNAAEGSFDSTFGSGGVVAPVTNESAHGLVVTTEGNIVVTKSRPTPTNKRTAEVRRYLGN